MQNPEQITPTLQKPPPSSSLLQLTTITSKTYDVRTHAEHEFLIDTMGKNSTLREMQATFGRDFLRSLARGVKTRTIFEGEMLFQKAKPINEFCVLVSGRLGMTEAREPSDQLKDNKSICEKIQAIANKQKALSKKAQQVGNKKIGLPVLNSTPKLDKKEMDYCDFFDPYSSIGLIERVGSKTHVRDVFCCEESTLLVFEIQTIFCVLEAISKSKLLRVQKVLKHFAAFRLLEDEKLNEVIASMKTQRSLKNNLIYKEGSPATEIFILVQGQVKFSKESSLFIQNPNELYTDRKKLSQTLQMNENILQFADLTALYHYRPIKKPISISNITGVSLFGSEEVIYDRPREATATVNCEEALYFTFDFKKIIDIIGPKLIEKWKASLTDSLSNTILYRQGQYAEGINIENVGNIDYFYFDGRQSKAAPRKHRLAQINQLMTPSPGVKADKIEPFYNTFNFDKLVTNSRYSTGKEVDYARLTYDDKQWHIVGNSHSWTPIEKKVILEQRVSLKISPLKHRIDIRAPLMDQDYFKAIEKESKRINKEMRTARVTLTRRRK